MGERNAISSSHPCVTLSGAPPLVIAHRGACGYKPEHTLESYAYAIELGADFIEPDLVSTGDGTLIARHEPWLSDTTDIASHKTFAHRKTTRFVDGKERTDWFTSDFTLEEIKSLGAIQPFGFRDQSFNGRFEIPTLREIIDLAKKSSTAKNRTIGIYPETKHPSYHRALGLSLEARLLEMLAREGWTDKTSPAIVQSFEPSSLQYFRARSDVRLMQLVGDADECPYDFIVAQDPRTYIALVTDDLDEIARYANVLGLPKKYLVEADMPAKLLPKPLVAGAHDINLEIHVYTFRNEAQFVANRFVGDSLAEYRHFFSLGIDGVFTDFPDTAIAARRSFAAETDGT